MVSSMASSTSLVESLIDLCFPSAFQYMLKEVGGDEGIKKILLSKGINPTPQQILGCKVDMGFSGKVAFSNTFTSAFMSAAGKRKIDKASCVDFLKEFNIDYNACESRAREILDASCANPKCNTKFLTKLPTSTIIKCIACPKVFYCSKDCQVADMSAHKVTCSAFKFNSIDIADKGDKKNS